LVGHSLVAAPPVANVLFLRTSIFPFFAGAARAFVSTSYSLWTFLSERLRRTGAPVPFLPARDLFLCLLYIYLSQSSPPRSLPFPSQSPSLQGNIIVSTNARRSHYSLPPKLCPYPFPPVCFLFSLFVLARNLIHFIGSLFIFPIFGTRDLLFFFHFIWNVPLFFIFPLFLRVFSYLPISFPPRSGLCLEHLPILGFFWVCCIWFLLHPRFPPLCLSYPPPAITLPELRNLLLSIHLIIQTSFLFPTFPFFPYWPPSFSSPPSSLAVLHLFHSLFLFPSPLPSDSLLFPSYPVFLIFPPLSQFSSFFPPLSPFLLHSHIYYPRFSLHFLSPFLLPSTILASFPAIRCFFLPPPLPPF